MRLLKFFLYTILIFSLGWGFILFAGPSVLKWMIFSYSNGRVTVENVKVSSQLNLSIGKVYFAFDNLDDQVGVSGVSRYMNFDWSLFGDLPFLKVTAGSTTFDDIGEFDRIELVTPSFENINLKNFKIAAHFLGVDVKRLGIADVINVEGFFQDGFSKMSGLTVDIERLESVNPSILKVRSVRGAVSDIQLDSSVNAQKIFADLDFKMVSSQQLQFDASELSSEVNLENGQMMFDVNLHELNIKNLDGTVENFSAEGRYKNGTIIFPIKINVLNGSFAGDTIKLANIFANFEKQNFNEISANIRGAFKSVEFFSNGNFVGALPSNSFTIDLNYNTSTRDLIAFPEVNFDSPDLSQIKGSGKIFSHVKDFSKAIDCSYLDCMLSNLTSNITISFGTESVFVDSICLQKDCSLGVVSHKILTTDTKKIFDLLNSTQFLNPLFSIYLYGVVSSGKKIRLGHEINFN